MDIPQVIGIMPVFIKVRKKGTNEATTLLNTNQIVTIENCDEYARTGISARDGNTYYFAKEDTLEENTKEYVKNTSVIDLFKSAGFKIIENIAGCGLYENGNKLQNDLDQ